MSTATLPIGKTIRGYCYRITKCGYRYDGDLEINGEWVRVSPEALGEDFILAEFNQKIDELEAAK